MAWVSWDKMAQPKACGGLGIRDFQAFNDAFLGKLSWRILNNPEGLLSRILLGKYSASESFLEVTAKAYISHGWRGVLIGRDLIRDNLGWVVGNGSTINVWTDHWLSLTEKLSPMGPPTEDSSCYTVSDLLLNDGREWNLPLVKKILPLWESTIANIKPSVSGAPDKRIWLGTTSGLYTTKSGYHGAFSKRSEDEENHARAEQIQWSKGVWNLQTSLKIKIFLWKVFQEALPVGEVLMARRISADNLFKRCDSPKSINHLLLHCSFAQEVWRSAPFGCTVESRGFIDLKGVWLSLCDKVCLPPTGLEKASLLHGFFGKFGLLGTS